jgi:hypothetical protein
MRQIEALQQGIDRDPAAATVPAQRLRINELRQALALRLERLRFTGSL